MKRMQTIMAFIAMAFLLAACGGSEETSGENGDPANGGSTNGGNGGNGQQEETMTEEAIEAQYAQGQYNLTEDGAADDQYADAAEEDLPFPLPPDADVIASGQSEEMAYAVAMNVPSGQEAYEFYLQELPEAGYEVMFEARSDEQPQPPEGETEGEDAEGEDAADDDVPFSGTLVVESDDLRGTMRFDEVRAIVGMSAAAKEQAVQAREEFEAQMDAFEEELQQQEAENPPPDGESPEAEESPEQ